ncbi:hypothetical protein [Streptomyces sp. NPDC048282]|uniref:hypothetical protein n=1 Tax=Streptomyces sp. NPDC048282 TaxID=3365528 RepID=UPI0037230264
MLRAVTAGPEGSPPRSGATAPRSGATAPRSGATAPRSGATAPRSARPQGGYGTRPPAATDESPDGSAAGLLSDSLDGSVAGLLGESVDGSVAGLLGESVDGSVAGLLDESPAGSAAGPPDGLLDEFTAEPSGESAAEPLGGVPRGRGRVRSGCGLGAGR